MSYITVEVDIDHGRITARNPEKLPPTAKGVLTIVTPHKKPQDPLPDYVPLIKGKGKPVTIVSGEELDAIFWGD